VAALVALAAAGAGALALLLERFVGAPFAWRSLALAVGGGMVLWGLAAKHAHAPRFGAANRVTLGRGALVMLVVALVGAVPGAPAAWVAIVLALVGLALDGVDGKLARSRGEASAFGARFDMETDALLILALACIAWQFDKAGAWVVLSGAMRYGFVAASWAMPWLGRELPPSRRRQTVCVVQIVTLILCLVPFVAPPVSGTVALAGLLLLSASFAVDVAWLARHARS
jgi:phosphatidylglycerophosphate synthase